MDPAGLAIVGNGDVTVSGNRAVQVFEVYPGRKLAIRSLTIADGRADGIGPNIYDGIDRVGGGVFVRNGGALTVSHCVFSGNKALSDRQYIEDRGRGGAIYIDENATLEVTQTTFSGNSATTAGGAISNFRGSLEVAKSTFSYNRATFEAYGGGIANYDPSPKPASVANSTFFGKGATTGGGIWSGDYRASGGAIELRVSASTFSGNSAEDRGGAIYHEGDTVALKASILAGSPSGGNCAGTSPFIDAGYNVEDDDTCDFRRTKGSLPNTNPLLDPDGLQRNGGPTKTIALRPASLAVDLVGPKACPPPEIDQRGVARPQSASCDAGAYELVK